MQDKVNQYQQKLLKEMAESSNGYVAQGKAKDRYVVSLKGTDLLRRKSEKLGEPSVSGQGKKI